MNINNSEYLLSQYADDSSLILDGGDDPLRKSLYILENFSEGENLKWNQSGKFKLLGINYDIFTEDKTAVHFKQKIEKIRTLLNSWIYRDLTYMGKITVIKSLAMTILIQSLTVLPNPSDKIINEYRTFSIHSYGVESQPKLNGKLLLVSMRRGDLK